MANMWKNREYNERTCEECGKTFKTKSPLSVSVRWCSRRCHGISVDKRGVYKEPRKCVICGKEFMVTKHQETKTCSKTCSKRIVAQLSDDDIVKVLERLANGESIKVISVEYGISWKHVWRLMKRETYADIQLSPEIERLLQLRNDESKKRLERLSPEEVNLIKELIANKEPPKLIAARFGVSLQTVSSIKQGKLHANPENPLKPPNTKLTNDDIREIRRRISTGEQQLAIANDFKVSPTTITRIKLEPEYGCNDVQDLAIRETSSDLNARLDAINAADESRKQSGLRTPSSKLTIDQVRSIKRRLLIGGYRLRHLARHYKVSMSTITAIKEGKTYADIEPAPDPSPLLPGFD